MRGARNSVAPAVATRAAQGAAGATLWWENAPQLIITDVDIPQPMGLGDPDDQQTLVRALL